MYYVGIIIVFITALILTFLGINIRYLKKYHLINGFEDDFNNGKKTIKYAQKVGDTLICAGIILITLVVYFLLR